jgi:type I restriction enzyme, S subunit
VIVDLKPYAEYKDSRQSWLGHVPRHWPVLPNRALFAEIRDRDHADEDMLSVTITKGIIRQKALLTDSSKKDSSREDKSAYKLVQPRDIAYNKMRAWQGAIGASELRGIISPAYVVMRLRDECNRPSYYHHLFRTPYFAKEAERWSYGITSDMWSLRPEHFKMIYTPEPPPGEQAAIVRFLVWASGRLERAIRAKGKVITLLNERKQAISYRAVTRGLDPSVPLKPSGISSLGDIPQHWRVSQLRRLIKYGTSITYGIVQAGPDIEGGIPYIRTSDMKGQSLPRTGYLRTSREIDSSYTRSKVETGDLVVAIRATLGKGLLVPDYLAGANLTQGTAKVSPGERLTSQFLYYVFNSRYCQENIRIVAKGTTFLEITLEALRRITLAIPSCEEQEAICANLSDELRPLNTATDQTEREIELLREYRTRLVADVVTGKLDVREAAATLLQETAPIPIENEDELNLDIEPAEEEVAL